ncbi:MAG: 50S ribosomal protein L1 [Patescibacteria group bacterium]|nr:50S ribosomal protein L1 [Patescibacteria group bacterium]
MGKTKIKTIDDSQPEAKEKKVKAAPKEPVVANEPIEEKKDTQNNVKEVKKETKSPQNTNDDKKGAVRSRKYLKTIGKVEKNRKYSLKEAVSLAQKVSYSKFPGTIEAHINTSAKNLRGTVLLPFLAGRKLTILAFGQDAEKSGADIVGSDETIAEIEKGKINFDVIVTTPAWMPKLAKVAKVLGPRGLMPSPKNDTVTENLQKSVTELRGGKTEYKTENNGQVIHLAIGKVAQPAEEIASNIKTLYNTIGRSKIKAITLAASMGPGIKVDLSSI